MAKQSHVTEQERAAEQSHLAEQGQRHAVVIGAGFGGLAAAVRLGARGYRVTVVEKRDAPGGRAYVYKQDGFTFDGGPTVITAPFLFEELWTLTGGNLHEDVEMVPIDPFYHIRFHDGDTFRYNGDAAQMREEIAQFSPSDVEGYEAFLDFSRQIFEVGFERLSAAPFDSWSSMAAIVPDLLRLRSYRTVHGLVKSFIKHPKLQQVFSFHPLLIGGNPYRVTSIYALIAYLERKWGVWFPKGGTGSLVNGLVRLVERQGGQVCLNAEVSRIALKGRRAVGVDLQSGEHLAADVVVSNADSAWTYNKLLPESARSAWTNRRIDAAAYSMGLFVWYFGTRRRYEEVEHHTILLGPRYKELLSDIFDRKALADDFSLYLHRPTRTDSSLAPAGCDGFYVLSPVPHLTESGSAVNWSTYREIYRQKIQRYLERTVLPELGQHITTSRLLTPEDFRADLLAYRGAAFGLAPLLSQSAYFRPHNRSEDIDRLFLVGAGTHPGAGVPGVLSSAKVLDQLVPDAQALV